MGIGETLGYSILGIAIVFVMLIVLMGIIQIMGRVTGSKQPAAAPAAAPVAPARTETKAPAAKPAPGTAGSIDLHSVEPRTAALIMAIVADEMGAPINELRFTSIREI